MTNSNPSSCVCVFAIPGPPPKRAQQDNDQFTVDVSVSSGAVNDSPASNPVRKSSPWIYSTCRKTFQNPRQAFLSATDAERSRIISGMIRSLEIPFSLENIHWGLNFPADEQTDASRPGNLDEIIAGRLTGIAGSICRSGNDRNGHYMDVRITKLEKLGLEDYKKLFLERQQEGLEAWILENRNDPRLDQSWCLGFIRKLALESPKNIKWFGLKSVEVMAKEDCSSSCCSICREELKEGSQAIAMPCSHVFHGFCIFQWIAKNSTCPLCRAELHRRGSIN